MPVGPTGAGKTTIVNLISRFYDVQQGAVLVDGYNVKKVSIERATTKEVRPFRSVSIPACTRSSVFVSMLEVASSRMRILGSETMVRAKAKR